MKREITGDLRALPTYGEMSVSIIDCNATFVNLSRKVEKHL